MHAAIVKLDALTNTVRATAQHHDFFLVSRVRLALFLIGRVHVGRVGRKFAGAGIDPLVNRAQIHRMTCFAHDLVGGLEQRSQTTVSKTFFLQSQQRRLINVSQRFGFQPELDIDQLFDLREEPWINTR